MNISSAQYIAGSEAGQNASIKCTIDGTEIFVPLDPDNTEYQAILEWAKIDGNTIEEAD
jgi:hypothetical protein